MKLVVALLVLVPALGCDEKAAPSPAAALSVSVAAIASPADAAPPAAGNVVPVPTAPPTQVAAQHILIAYRGASRCPPGVTRSKAAAKTLATDVDAKAKAPGADFTALVAQYSEDPAAKERMGSLGKFSRDKMDKAFSDAAFNLAVDGVSDVVETPFGFHIIKRNQ
jgi:hypothetical protein